MSHGATRDCALLSLVAIVHVHGGLLRHRSLLPRLAIVAAVADAYAVSSTRLDWHNLGAVVARSYTCGYCGDRVGPDRGYYATASGAAVAQAYIYVCSSCPAADLLRC
jgi:hypothetical protein